MCKLLLCALRVVSTMPEAGETLQTARKTVLDTPNCLVVIEAVMGAKPWELRLLAVEKPRRSPNEKASAAMWCRCWGHCRLDERGSLFCVTAADEKEAVLKGSPEDQTRPLRRPRLSPGKRASMLTAGKLECRPWRPRPKRVDLPAAKDIALDHDALVHAGLEEGDAVSPVVMSRLEERGRS